MAKMNKGMISNDSSKHANLPTESFTKAYPQGSYYNAEIGNELSNVYSQMSNDVSKAKKDTNLRKV